MTKKTGIENSQVAFCGRKRTPALGRGFCLLPENSLAGCGIDDGADLGNGVCREPSLLGVLANCSLVRGDVDAVNLVVCDITLEPLDAWSHGLDHAAGFLRDGVQLIRGEFSGSREFPAR